MRRLFLIATLALATLALAACGGGGGEDDGSGAPTASAATSPSENVLAAAAASAAGSGSSKVSFTITTQIPGQEAPITLRGEGEFDYAAKRGRLTYDFSQLLAATGQEGLGDEPVEMILDGNVFYMKWSLFSAFLPGAKPWIKFDLEELSAQQGIDLGQFQQLNQGDPASILSYLQASGTVEEAGTEEIDGVQTTHFTATIDLDRVAEQAPADVREQVQTSIDQLQEQTGLSELPVEVWVDGDGLPRRIQYSYATSVDGEDVNTVLVMDLSDYGVDVTVEPPPADQVSDLAELTSSLAS